MKKYVLGLIGVAALAVLMRCGGKTTPVPEIPKEVKEQPSVLKINRFDSAFFALKNSKVAVRDIQTLHANYGSFFTDYVERMVMLARGNDSIYQPYLVDFLYDPQIVALYDSVQKQVLPYLPTFTKELDVATKAYVHYFPKRVVPTVITYFFGFNYVVVAGDSTVGIALDQYLGAYSNYYQHLPEYIKKRKRVEYMVPDVLKGWGLTEFESPEPRIDLLDEMIYHGKVMYFLDALLPDMSDTLKIGYTQRELQFCIDNEYMIWSHFVEGQLLYEKNYNIINKLIGEAPFSSGMPKESPGRTGIWVGWQIVRSFMKQNPDISIAQLMDQHDAKKILSLSKYKPKKP